jgi:quercetin dioxygenase-like cupin family protein
VRQILACGVAVSLVIVLAASAQDTKESSHVLVSGPEIKWGEPPLVLEKGASFAVISGHPFKPGTFVVRLKMPAGYKIAPHWTPTDEHVTVLSGTLSVGMGEKFAPAAMKDVPAGGSALLRAEIRHFLIAKTAATVEFQGTGPFALTYVNPADDPRTRPTK